MEEKKKIATTECKNKRVWEKQLQSKKKLGTDCNSLKIGYEESLMRWKHLELKQQQQYNKLATEYENWKTRYEESSSKCNHLEREQQQQQITIFESLKQRLAYLNQQNKALSNNLSEQNSTICDIIEEKRILLQRLDVEVSIRHHAETVFDEEKLELNKEIQEKKLINRTFIIDWKRKLINVKRQKNYINKILTIIWRRKHILLNVKDTYDNNDNKQ